jgi:ERG8-type phosphomevalonate kinase
LTVTRFETSVAQEESIQLDSLSLPPNKESLDRLPRFNHLNTPIGDVHKTGLGSSAALITSLVAALLLHFSVIPASSLGETRSHDTAADNSRQDLDFIHNTSQYIHCLAQGKVGSGFDISSAVYGSQVYKRFDESVLRSLMDDSARPVPSEVWVSLRDPALRQPLANAKSPRRTATGNLAPERGLDMSDHANGFAPKDTAASR